MCELFSLTFFLLIFPDLLLLFFPNLYGHTDMAAANILNIPLREDFTPEQYHQQFNNVMVPFIRRFRPDLIMVSAGFDARYVVGTLKRVVGTLNKAVLYFEEGGVVL